MTGVEIAVGYVFAWMVRKARRVAGRLDAEVDQGLDTGMDRLHGLISQKLGEDPALKRVTQEAESGQEALSSRSKQRLVLALEDALDEDQNFASEFQRILSDLEESAAGRTQQNSASGNVFLGPVAMQVGNENKQDNHFGVSG